MKHFILTLIVSMTFGSFAFAGGGHGHYGDDRDKRKLVHPADFGPYNVGTVTIKNVSVTGGNTVNMTLWYPTKQRALKQAQYVTDDISGAFYSSGAKFILRSPNNAIENAKPASGRFPLIINSHGAIPPFSDLFRLINLPKHEHMASHGFVVLGFNRVSASDAQDAEDIKALMDEMATITGNSILDKVKRATKKHRTGVTGYSSGGPAAIMTTAGTTTAGEVVPDRRVKGVFLIEPSINAANTAAINVPYVVTDGSPFFDYSGFIANDTPLASPRYRVTTHNSAHISKFSGLCSMIEENRNIALAITGGTLGEPLIDAMSNENASFARTWWNLSEILFGVGGFTLGNAREFCDTVGVVDANGPLQDTFFDLDLDDNGLTDTPPFNTDFASNPSISPERLNEAESLRLGVLYEIAFYKVHLSRDNRYKRFLKPRYSDDNEANATLEVYKN